MCLRLGFWGLRLEEGLGSEHSALQMAAYVGSTLRAADAHTEWRSAVAGSNCGTAFVRLVLPAAQAMEYCASSIRKTKSLRLRLSLMPSNPRGSRRWGVFHKDHVVSGGVDPWP